MSTQTLPRRATISRQPRQFAIPELTTTWFSNSIAPTWEVVHAIMLRMQRRVRIATTWIDTPNQEIEFNWWIGKQSVHFKIWRYPGHTEGCNGNKCNGCLTGYACKVRRNYLFGLVIMERQFTLYDYSEWLLNRDQIDGVIHTVDDQIRAAQRAASQV